MNAIKSSLVSKGSHGNYSAGKRKSTENTNDWGCKIQRKSGCKGRSIYYLIYFPLQGILSFSSHLLYSDGLCFARLYQTNSSDSKINMFSSLQVTQKQNSVGRFYRFYESRCEDLWTSAAKHWLAPSTAGCSLLHFGHTSITALLRPKPAVDGK